jgi:SAM-dependent methyltransferase
VIAMTGSWRQGLFPRTERGFADDPYWYDLHVASEPRYQAALEEVVRAAPPLPAGARVADLGAGTGALALCYAAAYPLARLHLIDRDGPKLELAQTKLGQRVTLHQQTVDPGQPGALGCGDYDLVVSGLTLHVIADRGSCSDEREYAARNRALMVRLLGSLRPGGAFVYADFIRHGLGVREHLALLDEAGFAEADCAWRAGDLGVFGGQRPGVFSK